MTAPVTLPYSFDSTKPARLCLYAAAASVPAAVFLNAVMQVRETHSLSFWIVFFVNAAIGMAIVVFLVRLCLRLGGFASGVLDGKKVTLAPLKIFGLKAGIPDGVFDVDAFRAVRLMPVRHDKRKIFPNARPYTFFIQLMWAGDKYLPVTLAISHGWDKPGSAASIAEALGLPLEVTGNMGTV